MKNLKKQFNIILTSGLLLTYPSITNAKVLLEDVFQKYTIKGKSEYSEIHNVTNLPDPDITDLIIQIINIFIRVSSILALLGLTVAGVLFIISRGEGDTNLLEKAKKTATYTVVGVIIIMLAYAIVFGITSLQYNTL